jgi:hypothetical protein
MRSRFGPRGGAYARSMREEVYEVHQIVGKRSTPTGGVEYRIRWLGYSKDEDTCASELARTAPFVCRSPPSICHDSESLAFRYD